MIQAIIFDIGGVLIRTQDHAPRRQIEQRFGLPPGDAERIVLNSKEGLAAQRGELTEEQNWLRVQTELRLSDDDLSFFRRQFWAGDILDTALIDAIRRLRPRYQTAIISNALPGLMTLLTGKHPIADAFDVIVGSGDVGVAKPDPAIYQMVLQQLGRLPEDAIFIDDAPRNIDGARAVGLHAIHYTPGLDLVAALEGYGVTL